jgi:hypothetical protein
MRFEFVGRAGGQERDVVEIRHISPSWPNLHNLAIE